jgi:undecaprenyl phosphate-alpha-L-ara4N flippase subunit ArnE
VTAIAIALCVLCQLLLVAGQLLLKRAMTASGGGGEVSNWRAAVRLAPGVGCLAAWFFLWLGLLEQWELSRVFPFEGLNPVLLVIAAWFFFGERMSAGAWVGVGLVAVGIVLVSGS